MCIVYSASHPPMQFRPHPRETTSDALPVDQFDGPWNSSPTYVVCKLPPSLVLAYTRPFVQLAGNGAAPARPSQAHVVGPQLSPVEVAAAPLASRSSCSSPLLAAARFCSTLCARNGTRPTWPFARVVCLQLPLVFLLAPLFCLCLWFAAAAARSLLPAAARSCLALRTRYETRPTRLFARAVCLQLPLVILLALAPLPCSRCCAAASRTGVGPAWLPARVVRMQVSRVLCLCFLLPLACCRALLSCVAVRAPSSPPTLRAASPCWYSTRQRSRRPPQLTLDVRTPWSSAIGAPPLLPLLALLRPPRVHRPPPLCLSKVGFVSQCWQSHRSTAARHHHGLVGTSEAGSQLDRWSQPRNHEKDAS